MKTRALSRILSGIFSFIIILSLQAATFAAANWRDVTPMDSTTKNIPQVVDYSLRNSWNNAQILNFTSPMVKPEDCGKPLTAGELPLSIAPDLGWSGEWLDPTTLQLRNKKRLPLSTTLRYASRGEQKSLKGLPLKNLKEYTPYPFGVAKVPEQINCAADGTLTFSIAFANGRVAPAALKEKLIVYEELAPGKGGSRYSDDLQEDLKKMRRLPVLSVNTKDGGPNSELIFTIKPEDWARPLRITVPSGFAGVDGPVGLESESTWSGVGISSLLEVKSIESRQSDTPPWQRTIAVATSRPIKPEEFSRYLKLSPEMDFKVEEEAGGRYLIKGDFTTRPRVSVTVLKGLQNAERNGLMLTPYTEVVTFEDFMPSLALGEQGSALSPGRPMRVPLTTINVDQVQVTLREMPEQSLPLMVMGFYNSYRAQLATPITTRTADVNGVVNRISERSIDLKDLAGDGKGIFFLTVVDAGNPEDIPGNSLESPSEDSNLKDGAAAQKGSRNDDGQYNDEYAGGGSRRNHSRKAQKLVVISDIGLVARAMPDKLTVWANSLATAQPYAGARVRVFSSHNILLAEGVTDSEGLYTAEYADTAALVIVSTPSKPGSDGKPAERSYDDINYLKLDRNLTGGNNFDTGGKPYLTEGYEAFCYTPRGVYRPGETVPFRALLRDSAMRAPLPFPITWKVFSSTGRTAGQGSAMLSFSGGASFSLELVPAAPTGEYTLKIFLPGQEGRPLGITTFSVEDLAPPRIELKLSPNAQVLAGKDGLELSIDAKYLFGAPAAGAAWEASLRLNPLVFSHPDWKAFDFPPPDTRYESGKGDNKYGTLDEEGHAVIGLNPGDDYGYYAQALNYSIRVMEDGGRWVAKSISIPYFPKPFLLGWEAPRQVVTAGSVCSLKFAAVTPEGKPAALQSLKARIYFDKDFYFRSERGYDESTESKELQAKDLKLEKGLADLEFTPAEEGRYRIVLREESESIEREFTLRVWPGIVGSEAGASPLIDRVMLTWDKPAYTPGETAKLSVRSPFPGKLLLVVENDKERLRKIIDLDKAESSVEFPVADDMGPNAYCSAWVIRPVVEGEKWGAHRAFGLVPLMLEKSGTRINVAVDAPERFRPKSDLPVSVTLTDSKGAPVAGEVTIALIDEGLLSLTNQKTPDPFAFFSAKRAMLGCGYDRYDELVPLTVRAPLAFAAGGDGAADEASMSSPVARKLEMLTVVRESMTVGPDGKVGAVLALPEYSGKGRLMVVAASPTAVGSAASNVQIARDMTVEATTPRMVAPGDTFIVPLVLYATDNKPRKATVTAITEGPLEVTGEKTFAVELGGSVSRQELYIPVKALNESALGVLRISTAIADSQEPPFEQHLELPVRPPFPRRVLSGGGVARGNEAASITIDGDFMPGTQKARLSFADSPGVSLTSALEYLRDYPHGCLEQTASTTWPFVGAPALLRSLDPAMADNESYKKALDYGLRRLLSMQRPDGSFSMWPGENQYNSHPYAWGSAYATHLLLEARNAGGGLVPADAYNSAVKWLKRYLSSPLSPRGGTGYGIGYELSTRAYIAYVLTLNGEPPLGWMQFLTDQGDTLNASARIFLAGAYALAEGKPDPLRKLGQEPFKDGDYGWSYESPARNEALRLLMWVYVDPFAPESAALAARVSELGAKNRLSNTQESALAVLALGRYMEKTGGAREPYVATVKNAAGILGTFKNGDAPSFGSAALMPDGKKPGPVTVWLADEAGKESRAAVYYSWVSGGVPLAAPPAKEQGLRVLRRWTSADDDIRLDFYAGGKEGGFTQRAPEPVVRHGEKIHVTLYIEADEAMNSLVLTDIAPGGFELENPRLVPTSDGDRSYESNNPELQDDWMRANDAPPFGGLVLLNGREGVRAELRDDRLVLFVNQLPKHSVFTYSLRAVGRGEFTLPPVNAEGMYDTQKQALTLPAKVTILSKEDYRARLEKMKSEEKKER